MKLNKIKPYLRFYYLSICTLLLFLFYSGYLLVGVQNISGQQYFCYTYSFNVPNRVNLLIYWLFEKRSKFYRITDRYQYEINHGRYNLIEQGNLALLSKSAQFSTLVEVLHIKGETYPYCKIITQNGIEYVPIYSTGIGFTEVKKDSYTPYFVSFIFYISPFIVFWGFSKLQ